MLLPFKFKPSNGLNAPTPQNAFSWMSLMLFEWNWMERRFQAPDNMWSGRVFNSGFPEMVNDFKVLALTKSPRSILFSPAPIIWRSTKLLNIMKKSLIMKGALENVIWTFSTERLLRSGWLCGPVNLNQTLGLSGSLVLPWNNRKSALETKPQKISLSKIKASSITTELLFLRFASV